MDVIFMVLCQSRSTKLLTNALLTQGGQYNSRSMEEKWRCNLKVL